MNKKIYIILVVALVLLSAVFFIAERRSQSLDRRASSNQVKTEVPTIKPAVLAPADLEKDYQTKASQIITNYLKTKQTINLAGLEGENLKSATNKWLDLVLKTKSDLLNLLVPAKYKDLHLNLAINLDRLVAGLRGDEQQLKRGEDELAKLIEANPWLGSPFK